jgi:cell division protein FtsA
LANIIQARMSEIMDFVTYHLKQVGLDNKALNGGIILTGGGSQLKHLIQLTEYVTGMNARIGLPNEHLAAGHIDELSKPMYSTCIGLILKGYDDFENNRKSFKQDYPKMAVPTGLKGNKVVSANEPELAEEAIGETTIKKRKDLSGFWDKFRDRLIDIFQEDEDRHL